MFLKLDRNRYFKKVGRHYQRDTDLPSIIRMGNEDYLEQKTDD
jgi:hypothetical protein